MQYFGGTQSEVTFVRVCLRVDLHSYSLMQRASLLEVSFDSKNARLLYGMSTRRRKKKKKYRLVACLDDTDEYVL